jgi:hypothetical protein
VTQGLPNITFPLGNNYAGNVPVGRPGHPNNTLFFWGFENTAGSLTAPAGEMQLSPWLIWLGGGGGYEFDPRSSSDSSFEMKARIIEFIYVHGRGNDNCQLVWPSRGHSIFTPCQNGPMLLHPDLSISQNPNSLSNIMDAFWIDQPGGSAAFGSAWWIPDTQSDTN